MVDINLKATFLVDKYAAIHMPKGGGESIVKISGIEGTESGSSHHPSKGSVVMLAQSMTFDYGRRGIRVNCICPGGVEPLFRAAISGRRSPPTASNSTGTACATSTCSSRSG